MNRVIIRRAKTVLYNTHLQGLWYDLQKLMIRLHQGCTAVPSLKTVPRQCGSLACCFLTCEDSTLREANWKMVAHPLSRPRRQRCPPSHCSCEQQRHLLRIICNFVCFGHFRDLSSYSSVDNSALTEPGARSIAILLQEHPRLRTL